jgi:hypothetical protein
MGSYQVTIIAGAAKIQLRFLTYFSKRGMFLASHDKDFPVPYLPGEMPSSSPRVVENSARCAMVFSGTQGCPVSGLAVPCQGEGVSGFFRCLLADLVNVEEYETLISRVHS